MFCKLDVRRKSTAPLALSSDNHKIIVRYFVNRAQNCGLDYHLETINFVISLGLVLTLKCLDSFNMTGTSATEPERSVLRPRPRRTFSSRDFDITDCSATGWSLVAAVTMAKSWSLTKDTRGGLLLSSRRRWPSASRRLCSTSSQCWRWAAVEHRCRPIFASSPVSRCRTPFPSPCCIRKDAFYLPVTVVSAN